MSFVRIVRFFVGITLLLNSFVPQDNLRGQAENLTPVPTFTPQTESTTPSSELERSEEIELSNRIVSEQIDRYLAQMSVADKIGQLFIVAFEGNDVDSESDVAELIHVYRIGGVVISPRNRNFVNSRHVPEDAVTQVTKLTNQLQALSYGNEWRAEFAPGTGLTTTVTSWYGERLSETQTLSGTIAPSHTVPYSDIVRLKPQSLPLFIAVEQAGDGLSHESLPDTALRQGFTELPSQLALGATWDPELAEAVGIIVGQELKAVGVNMLLGPYLDVFQDVRTGQVGSLGVYSFGGDPQWVSTMGRAYIEGVHFGSQGQVVTIARHFPGQGNSDRLPSEEIATIPGTLHDLERNHLPPFDAVTSNITGTRTPPGGSDLAITDGLMSSHMYFSGLQGDPTAEVKPFGFSSQLQSLLVDSYSAWREDGLMMTNDLGAPAIRRFYKNSTPEFPVRQLVREAFLAGHDLLMLSNFSIDGSWETEKSNIKDVILYFRELYADDEEVGFRTRVDESVRRILQTKFRLYAADEQLEDQIRDQSLNSDTIETSRMSTTPLTVTSSLTLPAVNNVLSPISSTLIVSVPLESVLLQDNPYSVLAGEVKAASSDTIRLVSERSLTLLNPDPTGDLDPLPAPPQAGEKILIFTDNYLLQECENCSAETLVAPDEIEEIILRRYGEEATQQISAEQIKSATFEELDSLLNELASDGQSEGEQTESDTVESNTQTPPEIDADTFTPDDSPPAEGSPSDESQSNVPQLVTPLTPRDIEEADWIIFAMLDIVEDAEARTSSAVVKRFLREQGEQSRNKRIVVLALNAPYFLDGTEASRLTPYFGVNSKIRPFLVTAVRTLFKEASLAIVPQGNAPVHVPGTRFSDLSLRILPDPNVTIPIRLFEDGQVIAQKNGAEDENNGLITVMPGQEIKVQAYDIRDRNNNIVKDGTQIIFEVSYGDGSSILPIEPSLTVDGRAESIIPLERLPSEGATLTVYAFSEVDSDNNIRAESERIELLVQGDEIAPTPAVARADATVSPEPADEVPVDRGGNNGSDPSATGSETKPHIDWFTFLISLVTIVGMVGILVIPQIRTMPKHFLVRYMLWATVAGLSVYVIYGLFIPVTLSRSGYPWAPPLLVFVSMLIPLLWLQLRHE